MSEKTSCNFKHMKYLTQFTVFLPLMLALLSYTTILFRHLFSSDTFIRFRSDQISHIWLFATPWIAACQASLSITNSRSSLRLTSIESAMPSSHLILCRPLLLLPPIPPRLRVFSNESTLQNCYNLFLDVLNSIFT